MQKRWETVARFCKASAYPIQDEPSWLKWKENGAPMQQGHRVWSESAARYDKTEVGMFENLHAGMFSAWMLNMFVNSIEGRT